MSNIEIVETEKMLKGIEGDLFTYQEWKQRGMQVQRGQKAMLTIKLWKQVTKKIEGVEQKKFYLVNASLFGENQVEKIA